MSSNPRKLRFGRALRNVSGGTAAPQEAGPAPGRLRELQRRRQQLAEAEKNLREREAELADKERQVEDRLRRLAELIASVEEEKVEMLETNEEEIVSFSLSITEKVLQCEIEHGRYKMGEVVKSTLRAVRDKGALVVRVNPRDLQMTRAALQKLGQTFGTTRITTVPDESIPPASCCIETDSGKVFSEIPGRLERIRRRLLKNGNEDED